MANQLKKIKKSPCHSPEVVHINSLKNKSDYVTLLLINLSEVYRI